jgi:hypothetical protein
MPRVPPDPSTEPKQSNKKFGTRAQLSPARKVTVYFALIAVLALLIGAGFSNMSASNAPTALETTVIRSVALFCIAVSVTAYVIDRRSKGAKQPR